MIITLKRSGKCTDCGHELKAGTQAKWYRNGAVYCLDGHNDKSSDPGKSKPQTDWLTILREANEAAKQAYDVYKQENYKTPAFAVVEHANPADDSSEIVKTWAMNDVCGFVWIELKLKGNERFINDFKANGKLDNSDGGHKTWRWGEFRLSHYSGSSRWGYPWVLDGPGIGSGNGAMGAAEASARAFAKVMGDHGIDVYVRSRID
jgi:hypothetical protein